MPDPVEITRLKESVEHFKARMPRDLPDSFSSALEAFEKELGRTAPVTSGSPGERAVQEVGATGKGGVGVPMKYAAKGPDQPSPGQREARGIKDEIRDAAQRIVAEHAKS